MPAPQGRPWPAALKTFGNTKYDRAITDVVTEAVAATQVGINVGQVEIQTPHGPGYTNTPVLVIIFITGKETVILDGTVVNGLVTIMCA